MHREADDQPIPADSSLPDASRAPSVRPDVSIVVACYNVADTISETIASVRAQTHAGWEMICVDDGSSDATREILARHAESDCRIHVVHASHRGQPATKNHGVGWARADRVLILDADDVLWVNALEIMLNVSRRAGDDVIVAGGHELLDSTGRPLSIFRFPTVREFSVDEFLRGNRISVVSLVPRALLGGTPFDETLETCNDWNLWLTLADNGARCVPIPRVIFGYRLHTHNISREPDRMFDAARRLIQRWRPKARDPGAARDVLHRFACNYGAMAFASGDGDAIRRYFAGLDRIDYGDACLRAMAWHIRGAFEFVRGADGGTWAACVDDWLREIEPWLYQSPLAEYAAAILEQLNTTPLGQENSTNAVREFVADHPNARNIVVYGLGRNGVALLEHMRRDPAFSNIEIRVADDYAEELTFVVQDLPRDDPREWSGWPASTLAIVTPNECDPMVRTLERAGGRAGVDFLKLSEVREPALATERE